MTFLHVIKQNIVHNRRNYLAYFLNSVMAIMVFFLFALLQFHPQLQKISASTVMVSNYAQMGLLVGEVITVILSFIFLWYAFTYFLSTRQYDLGVLQLLGIPKKKFKRMIFLENLATGLLSILTGLLLGLFFEKAVLLVLGQFLHLVNPLAFYWPMKAILLTSFIFLFIFFFISIFTSFTIPKKSFLKLSSEYQEGDDIKKVSPLQGILGLPFLFLGYFFLFLFTNHANLTVLLSCVLFTSLGTFFIFKEGLVWFFLNAKNHSKNGKKQLWLSSFLFQLKDHATLFTLISLTASVAFIGAGMAQVLGSSEVGNNGEPTFSYTLNPLSETVKETEKVSQTLFKMMLKKDPHSTMTKIETSYFEGNFEIDDLKNVTKKSKLYWPTFPSLIKASDYNKLREMDDTLPAIPSSKGLTFYTFADSKKDLNAIEELDEKDRKATGTITINGKKQPIIFVKFPHFLNLDLFNVAIVSDAFYQEVEKENKKLEYPAPLMPVFILNFPSWDKDKKSSLTFDEFLQKEKKNEINDDYIYLFNSKFAKWQARLRDDGIVRMVGFLIGSIFFLFSASILTFRLFGKLRYQQEYYQALNILGVDKKDRRKMIVKDLAFIFFLPITFTFLHGAMAFWEVSRIANLSFWGIYFKLFLTYFAFQVLFFVGTSIVYVKKIETKIQ